MSISPRAVFMKWTQDGRESYSDHRTWSLEVFKTEMKKDAEKVGASVEFLTKEQYETATGKKVFS